MIKTDLLWIVVTMHLGLCEQYVKSLSLRALEFDFMFARVLKHCDNKALETVLIT